MITGASGFIGAHLVRLAISRGFTVHALVRETSRTEEIKALGAVIHFADLARPGSVKKVLERLAALNVSVHYVIHAAALTKAKSEEEFMRVNCTGTHNLLSELKQAHVKPGKIVFLSSLAASGPQELGNKIAEAQCQPITFYGKSKLQAEAVVKAQSPAPYIILRPTAVYGPGEKDLFTVFKMVSRGLNALIGRGRQELTFIYVKDLVELVLAALTSTEQNKTFFLSDGAVYGKDALGNAIAASLQKKSIAIHLPLFLVRTVAAISQYSAALVNRQSPLNLEKYKELTAASWNCEVEQTFAGLHYTPTYTLQQGVDETTRWYKDNKWI